MLSFSSSKQRTDNILQRGHYSDGSGYCANRRTPLSLSRMVARLFALGGYLLIIGCTQAPLFQQEYEFKPKLSNNWRYEVIAPHGPSSPLRNIVGGAACTVQFAVTLTTVHEFEAWHPHAGVTLMNSDRSKIASLLFIAEDDPLRVVPQLIHRDQREPKRFDEEFEVGRPIHTRLFFTLDSAGVAFVRNSELRAPGDDGGNSLFDFSEFELGFRPTEVEFYGAGVDAMFEQMKIQRGCQSPVSE